MKVKIVKNCNGILESEEMKIKSGYEEENFAYKLEFEFPDFLEEYNKIIEFELNGEKVADALLGDEYELKNNVTKYSYVPCQVVFTKEIDEEHTQVYKTNKFYLEFGNSINADIDIDPESEEVSVLNTLLEQVSLALEEVTDVIEKGNYAKEQGDYAKEQGDLASDEVERIETMLDNGELNGATFIPSINDSGDISWTNDKGLPNPQTKNVKGDTGLTPDISVGSTTTLAPGTNAYVEILGTAENPIINFYIPRGDNGRIEFRLVNELPEVGEPSVIYLVPEEDPEVQNRYDEYIWINNAWEKFGSASIDIDLDKYYTKEEIATILLDYVTNSSLTQTLSSYVTNQGLTTTLLDYVTKTDLTTELADYVKNTDYATTSKGGVIKLGNGFETDSTGKLRSTVYNYSYYEGTASGYLGISKGTLENVITGKNLETANNKVTEINENSTDTEYPSAKSVYNYTLGSSATTETTGETISVNTLADSRLNIDLKGNTSQDGTPTPDTPVNADVVTGDNNIKVEGKNLYDVNDIYQFADIVSVDNEDWITVTYDNTSGSSAKFFNFKTKTSKSVQEGATYKLIIEVKNVTGTGTINFASKQAIGQTDTTKYSTFGGLSAGVIIVPITMKTDFTGCTTFLNSYGSFSAGQSGSITFRTSVVKDNVDISNYVYEPYVSQTYPINLGTLELCKIGDYKDYIYKNNGNWYVHKAIGKVVLDGSEDETWSISDTGTPNYSYRYSIINYQIINGYGLSNNYLYTSIGASNTNQGFAILNTGTNVQIRIRYGEEQTINDFKTWLGTHNTIVYYILATSTDTQITDNSLITQLDNLYNAKSYSTTNISQENDNLPFILNVTSFNDTLNGRISSNGDRIDTLIEEVEETIDIINGEVI